MGTLAKVSVDLKSLILLQLSAVSIQVHLLLASLLDFLCAMLVFLDLVGHEAGQALAAFRQLINHITLELLIVVEARLDKL